MSFFNELLGGRGCNVDGTTTNNPVMRLTDQALNSFFSTQDLPGSGVPESSYEEATLVARGSHGPPQSLFHQNPPQVAMHHRSLTQTVDISTVSPNNWHYATSQPIVPLYHQQRMLMEQHFMTQMMHQQMHLQEQMRSNTSTLLNKESDSGLSLEDRKDVAVSDRISQSFEKTGTKDSEVDDLQQLLEEAWNTEGMEGTSDDIERFWNGVLRNGESESLDAAWKALHEHAMKHAWKPPETKDQIGYNVNHSNINSSSIHAYAFETENPYVSSNSLVDSQRANTSTNSNCDELYKQGMIYYSEGHVDEAILAFEGAIQIHPEQADNTTVCENSDTMAALDEIWNMLGKCHAEMDKDSKAILCYTQALDYDPFNLSALLALGTSHVNEMNSNEALKCLRNWVKHNPKFHGLEARLKKQYNTDTADDVYADGTLMDEVLQLMLAVEKFDPNDGDVQVVLGVLHNVTQDLDAAAEAFQKALRENPEDYSLLNKVGATLANGQSSADAIQYYAKALKIRPLYARAWLNLGIAYANLSQYDEAVKAYIQALAISPDAMHIWDYLESVFTFQRHYDLITLCRNSRDPVALAEKMDFVISTPLYSK